MLSCIVNTSSSNSGVPELVSKIVNWHYNRNLVHGSDNKNQTLKLMQEFGELEFNLLNSCNISDDVGDMLVVLINLMEREGINLQLCFESPGCSNIIGNPNSVKHNEGLTESIADYLNFHANIHQLNDESNGQNCTNLIYGLIYWLGQLSDCVCRGKSLSEPIGQTVRSLFMLAESHNLTIESCLQQAWNDIKDRKGMMVDGVFVKEADLT